MSQPMIVLLVTIVMVVMFFWGYIPIAATSLFIPIALIVTGILEFDEAMAGFSDKTVVSLVALFMLGAILKNTSFLEDLKAVVLSKLASKRNGKMLVLLVCMLMSVVLSIFLQPTNTMLLIMPFLLSMSQEVGLSRKGVVKACTDLANTSNNVIPMGSALTGYLTFNAFLEKAGATERFKIMDPFIAKTPVYIVYFLFIFFVGYRLYIKDDVVASGRRTEVKTATGEEKEKKAKLSPERNKFGKLLFFTATICMIIAAVCFSVDIYKVAMLAVLIGLLTKVISFKDALKNISWDTIFIYGGTLSLSAAMTKAGINDIIADYFSKNLMSLSNPLVITSLIFAVTFVTTQFCSNRTVGAVFRPAAVVIGTALGVDPRLTLLAAHYGSSMSVLTPMSSTVQLVGFEAGGFKMKEFFWDGLIPGLVFFIVFLIWFPICINMGWIGA